MTRFAGREIVLVVTGGVAPLNVRFGKGLYGRPLWWKWMSLVTIVALGNRLSLPRAMRDKPVGNDRLPTRGDVVRSLCGECLEGSVTVQAGFFRCGFRSG